MASPRAPANRAFAVVLALWAAHVATEGFARTAATAGDALRWAHVNAWYFLPIAGAVLVFLSRFPARRPGALWRYGVGGGGVAVALAFVGAYAWDHALVVADVASIPNGSWGAVRGPLYYANNALTLAALALVVVVLARELRVRAVDSTLRRQTVPVVAAFAATLAHGSFFFVTYALVHPDAVAGGGAWFTLVPVAAVAGAAATGAALWRLARGRELVAVVPALAAVAGVADVFLLAAARAGTLPLPGYTTSARVWTVAFASLVAYALVRYEVLGFGERARRRVSAGVLVLASAGVVVGASALVLAVFGVNAVSVAAAQVASLAALATLFAPLRRLARTVADRIVPADDASDVQGRKVEVYRAALERAFEGDGTVSQTSATMLRGLRSELGLTDRDHALLLATVRPRVESAPGGAPAPGAVLLGRYRVERVLGTGATSSALLCRDEVVGRACVVKVLHPEKSGGDAAAARVLKEARALGAVRSPHVVTLFDAERVGDDVYLVLDYAAGGSAEDAMAADGPFALPVALRLARDVLAGLAAVHAAGLVHRDVKTQNVLLDAEGRALLADFGAARITEAARDGTVGGLTATGFQPGTLVTMAPEQVRGVPADHRVDVYATGAVLYRLLAGEHYLDFRDLDEFDVREAILMEPPRLPHPRVPATLEPVLRKALAKRAEDRWQSAEEMLAALPAAEPSARA